MIYADDLERLMLQLVNEERTSRGLTALQLEMNLNLSAELHSVWMLEQDIFSHTGTGNSTPTARMVAADFDLSGSWRTAENIAIQSIRGAAGYADDVADLHTALMNSAGHRANILNPDLKYIGIGIEVGDFDYTSGTWKSVIVTQNFANTQGSVDLDVASPSAIVGDNSANVLVGTAGNDQILGLAGDDDIDGSEGDDVIDAGAGDDKVQSGRGADAIHLGDGNDYVRVGGGVEKFVGGAGKDYISYLSSSSGVRVDLESNEVSGSWASNDEIEGFESVAGSRTGDDTLLGTSGSNTLRGYGGDDKLYGRSGSDKLEGGDGADYLDGGHGTDILTGGAGADTFHFDKGEDKDRITDFQNNIDRIELDDFTFAAGKTAFDFATQVGSDVVFDFGGGDVLTVDDATIAQLLNDVFLV